MSGKVFLTAASAPCKSCPYRQDVPSGVWDAEEYDKLPGYDGEMVEQARTNTSLFLCHQRDGNLCAGWLATHGPENLLALRLSGSRIDPAIWSYMTTTPVFASGQEACDHGKRDIINPGDKARRVIGRLVRDLGSD